MTNDPGGEKSRAARIVRLVGTVVVPALVALVALLFKLWPDLSPCIGGRDASFTGAPVFPHVRFRDHLVRNGMAREDAANEPNLVGAEVRFSYRTNALRGQPLTITWTLMTIERDGTIGPVERTQDRAIALAVTPDACGSERGKDLFVEIPARGRRYRIVLEMYRGDELLTDRLALTQTAPFRG